MSKIELKKVYIDSRKKVLVDPEKELEMLEMLGIDLEYLDTLGIDEIYRDLLGKDQGYKVYAEVKNNSDKDQLVKLVGTGIKGTESLTVVVPQGVQRVITLDDFWGDTSEKKAVFHIQSHEGILLSNRVQCLVEWIDNQVIFLPSTGGYLSLVSVEKVGEETSNPIINNLINDTTLGLSKDKKETLIYVASALLNESYEPEFVAGVLGNIYAEGTYGLFESSSYISHPENKPAYLIYMDEYHKYNEEFSGKNISEVGVAKTKILLDKIEGTIGQFGLGSVQWTGVRTPKLIDKYIEVCGIDGFPTKEEMLKAESMLIVQELSEPYYNEKVYQKWKNNYSGSDKAVYHAGSIVCLDYETPTGYETKAVTRGGYAENIYDVMMGNK